MKPVMLARFVPGRAAVMTVTGKEGGEEVVVEVALEKSSPRSSCWFPQGINNELNATLITRRPYI